MAKQKGILPVKGTIGNLTFYKSQDGYLIREKGGIDAKRIATDPAFQRTRENGAEFGRAGKAGKVFRNSVRALAKNASDSKVVSRMTKIMHNILKEDTTNPRGLRTVADGKIELLDGFEFNKNGQLTTTLYVPFTTTIDRVTGAISVNIPAFIPANMIAAPGGATHYRINAAGTEVDFVENSFTVDIQTTGQLPIEDPLDTDVDLEASVTPNSTLPLFVLIGIEFFQEVNGELKPLLNKAFNVLAVVKVSIP
jgi:hypothetical protein